MLLLPLAGNSISSIATATVTSSSSPSGQGNLSVTFTGLRSSRGVLRICLTQQPRYFPTCVKDPHALKRSIAAEPAVELRLTGIAPGVYALSALHDENDNNRADMMLGIPREGVGFSENPRIRFGPPSFAASRFVVAPGQQSLDIHIKYFL